jgi:putative heme-binding domain-containing protein
MNWFTKVHCLMLRSVAVGALLLVTQLTASADEPQWIWSPSHTAGEVPQTACHFRRSFTVRSARSANLYIAADDTYELYINGRRVGSGDSSEVMDRYEISKVLRNGRNLVAVKVTNTEGSTAALAVRLEIDDHAVGDRSYSSDSDWLTSLRPLPLWFTLIYNDSRWEQAESLGPLGRTPPWDDPEVAEQDESSSSPESDEPQTAPESPATQPESQVVQPDPPEQEEEFLVERVLDGDATGSLIAMTFNEFGHVVAAREDGELLLMHDSDQDHVVDTVRVYSDQVKNCQGILCLNGEVFVCGDGPDGPAVYRMSDTDRNGKLDEIRTLMTCQGPAGEYGAHAITLGPDGFLYLVLGSQTQPNTPYRQDSPLRNYYEGDLVTPRCEDPDGHSDDVKAPGGAILRMKLDGENLQLVAGGLHNAYDLAFDRSGELFTHDGDMQVDLGAPWYRPTAVYHVVPGAEFGWRSGWAKWPDYFLDRLPVTLDTGRGAPTGMIFYNHLVFPDEYRNALFVSDWANGRIHGIKLKANGSSYAASSELFVDDASMHVTDMAVGPDGCIYFVTGGRGTEGGLYRIRWAGKVHRGINNLGEGISAAIRQPQLEAAWSRQKIAALRRELGSEWERMVPGVALSSANPWYYRTRALDLMQLFGPIPSKDLLIRLSVAENERVRAKVASLMGLQPDAEIREALVSMLDDADPSVRRRACESLVRGGLTAPVGKLIGLLQSEDRYEAWCARRLLEEIPSEQWKELLIDDENHRLVIQSSLALLTAEPSKDNAMLVLQRIVELMNGFVTDRDFTDMLRVVQLAMIRGQIAPDEVPQLQKVLAEEFPSGNELMNRELVRLLTYLQTTSIMDRYISQLQSDSVPEMEKLHLALHLCYLRSGWTLGYRIQVLEFLESAQNHHHADNTFGRYLARASRDFAKTISDDEARLMLAEGACWPRAALALLYRMPEQLDDETRAALTELDEKLLEKEDLPSMRLKVGIAAVLARSGDAESQAYLRDLWDRDIERRPALALGLAQWPSEENWSYIVESLPIFDGDAARELIVKLRLIHLAPRESEYFRQVILHGLKLGENGAEDAIKLLEHWTGEQIASDSDWKSQLAAWKRRYAELWPDHQPAEPPAVDPQAKWTYSDLLRQLTGSRSRVGSVDDGAQVFATAGCAMCHRFGDQGADTAPDLTSVGQRMMKKQVLRSMLHPSHSVNSDYLAKTVITQQGRVHVGETSPSPETGNIVVVEENGDWVTVSEDAIDEKHTQRVSPMPDGLLDSLTLEEIADLFAYLTATPNPRLADRPSDKEVD